MPDAKDRYLKITQIRDSLAISHLNIQRAKQTADSRTMEHLNDASRNLWSAELVVKELELELMGEIQGELSDQSD